MGDRTPTRHLQGSLTLLPVIELSPFDYAREERESPHVSAAENPEAWSRHWLACLADSGITGVTPLSPGSWFVPVSRLREPEHLRQIFLAELRQRELSPDELQEPEEQLGALSGGYALCSGEEVLLPPGCCGD